MAFGGVMPLCPSAAAGGSKTCGARPSGSAFYGLALPTIAGRTSGSALERLDAAAGLSLCFAFGCSHVENA